VRRQALITLILGATLVIAPAARAGGLMQDGGGSGSAKAVVLHTDVLGGNGNPASISVPTTGPYGMNEAAYQAVLSRGKGFNLRLDILDAMQRVGWADGNGQRLFQLGRGDPGIAAGRDATGSGGASANGSGARRAGRKAARRSGRTL
jgi:hypothetical protein